MPEPLYYLSFPSRSSGGNVDLASLASLPGWHEVERFFDGSDETTLQGIGRVMPASLATDIQAAGFIRAEVASTFDLAWDLVKQNLLPCWGFALAAAQNAGRGQLRRPWHSRPGNLYVTFRLPQDLNVEAGALLTGYLLQRALAALGAAVKIKWPNDLVQGGHKVGGILLEERDGVLLAGVGLNLAQAPSPTDLEPGAGQIKPFPAGVLRFENDSLNMRSPVVLNVWLTLVKQITLGYEQDLAWRSLEQRLALLESCLAFKGAMVTVSEPGFSDTDPSASERRVSGQITGLGPKGELRLLLSSGRERLLHNGTLSFSK